MENSTSIEELIKTIKVMTYQWQFSLIITKINERLPNFFDMHDNILYIIMKFILIDKLRSDSDIETQTFYSNYLLPVLTRTHPNNYETKNAFFLELIANRNLCANNQNNNNQYISHLNQQSYFEKFNMLIEKTLSEVSSSEIEEYNDHNNNDVEYFSDFEKDLCVNELTVISKTNDILKNPINKNNEKIQVNQTNITTNISNPLLQLKNLRFKVINERDDVFKTRNEKVSNYQLYSKQTDKIQRPTKPVISSSSSTCVCDYDFYPKYSRKVNISKKIVRKFKKYLKTQSGLLTNQFWIQFTKENFLPPFVKNDEKIEFKSFSHSYLKWLFNHEGGNELYKSFVNARGDIELKTIYSAYDINDIEDQRAMEKYFKDFCFLFNDAKTLNDYYIQYQLEDLCMLDKDPVVKRDELFDPLIAEFSRDERRNRKKRGFFDRSREIEDNNYYNPYVKSDSNSSSSSDKEE